MPGVLKNRTLKRTMKIPPIFQHVSHISGTECVEDLGVRNQCTRILNVWYQITRTREVDSEDDQTDCQVMSGSMEG